VFPEAHLTFDRFHVVKLMNEAVDEVRREEQRGAPELKKTRFLWLKNKCDLKADEQERFAALRASTIKTAHAYRFKVALQGI
jgi:transposase